MYGSSVVITLDRSCLIGEGLATGGGGGGGGGRRSSGGLSGDFEILRQLDRLQFTSSGPSLLLHFASDVAAAGTGFEVDYLCGAPPPLTSVFQCIDDPRCAALCFVCDPCVSCLLLPLL